MTGTLVPDVTGNYTAIGRYNGKPFYQLDGNGWAIWYDADDENWFISQTPGYKIDNCWYNATKTIEGLYTAVAPATGDATVAEI